MDILKFNELYDYLKDADQLQVDDLCDHLLHEKVGKQISKVAAKRNVLKHGGREFICRQCDMLHNNPMTKVVQIRRDSSDEVDVLCPECGQTRKLAIKCYYGELKQPYYQICKSCSQSGKKLTDEQKTKISDSLFGRELTEEHKANIGKASQDPQRLKQAIKNLKPWLGRGWNKGQSTPINVRQKISQANLGKKRTEEQCLNISSGRKKMLQEVGGFTEEHRQKLREAALRQYANGFDPNLYHISGWHDSPKAGHVFFRSSYEKKAYELLDADPEIKVYRTESVRVSYLNPDKKYQCDYLIDIEIIGNKTKLIEIKPSALCNNSVNQAKKKAAEELAVGLGGSFEIWDEVFLFGAKDTEKKCREYADSLRSEVELQEHRISNANRSKKHYHDKIATDKITILCKYCQCQHTLLRLRYDSNVKKNGHYICKHESACLNGSKPKLTLRKVNPHAAEGKKQCNQCKEIKLFDEFGIDKTKADGYATRCKKCRAERNKNKYNEK